MCHLQTRHTCVVCFRLATFVWQASNCSYPHIHGGGFPRTAVHVWKHKQIQTPHILYIYCKVIQKLGTEKSGQQWLSIMEHCNKHRVPLPKQIHVLNSGGRNASVMRQSKVSIDIVTALHYYWLWGCISKSADCLGWIVQRVETQMDHRTAVGTRRQGGGSWGIGNCIGALNAGSPKCTQLMSRAIGLKSKQTCSSTSVWKLHRHAKLTPESLEPPR